MVNIREFCFMKNADYWMLAILCTNVFIQRTTAQSDIPKIEIGAHCIALRYGEYDRTDTRGGGKLTVDLNRHLALEGELNFFRERRLFNGILNSKRRQELSGVKAGWHQQIWYFCQSAPWFHSLQRTSV
jgi:hypothetical protein